MYIYVDKPVNLSLSDFKRSQIAGVRVAGVSVTKTAELFGVVRCTVSKVMTTFEKEGKPPQWSKTRRKKEKENCLIGDRWTLRRIVRKDHKNTAPKITADLDDHLENPVSLKTVRKELYKVRFHERASIGKPYKNKFVSGCFYYFVQPLYIYKLSLSYKHSFLKAHTRIYIHIKHILFFLTHTHIYIYTQPDLLKAMLTFT